MACAGDRYSTTTGNIRSYANRGDMTGVKAALMRDVDVNAVNIAGWTPLHAAAAGGQTKVLKALLRAKADINIRDRGGNSAAHEAARGGHLQCLETLADAGMDMSAVRLSQTKGVAVRDFVQKASRGADKARCTEPDDSQEQAADVGYARQKQKSCAFWGPRRAPLGNKIKREILRAKRNKGNKGDAPDVLDETLEILQEDGNGDISSAPERTPGQADPPPSLGDEFGESTTVPVARSYAETLRAVEHQARCSRKSRRAKKDALEGPPSGTEEILNHEVEHKDMKHCNSADSTSEGDSLGEAVVLNDSREDESA